MNKLFASFVEHNRKPDVVKSDLFENKKFNDWNTFYELIRWHYDVEFSIVETGALENNLYYILLRDSRKDETYYGFLQEKSPEVLSFVVFSDSLCSFSETVVFVQIDGDNDNYFKIFLRNENIHVTVPLVGSLVKNREGVIQPYGYRDSLRIFLSIRGIDLDELFGTDIFDFYYRNIPDLPTDFPDYPSDKILYRKNIDSMIAGIAMIDIPVETV